MYQLENWRYHVRMQCGGDVWAISGQVVDRPGWQPYSQITISQPVNFDEQNMVVTTYSGSQYKLGYCAGNLKQQIDYIKEDIEQYNNHKEKKDGPNSLRSV